MANQHRISKEKAAGLLARMRSERQAPGSPWKRIPEGFMLDAEAVKQLVSTRGASKLVITFGLQQAQGPGNNPRNQELTPILFVVDENHQPIEERPRHLSSTEVRPADSVTRSGSLDIQLHAPEDDLEGGFLDEVQRIPPPYIQMP